MIMLDTKEHNTTYKGFADLSHDSQIVFAVLMQAFAHPGSLYKIPNLLWAPDPLSQVTAAILLGLCDFETPLWLDKMLNTQAVQDYLRFHIAAPIVESTQNAKFAVVAHLQAMPHFDEFSLGSLDYPDESTTLIIQLESLKGKQGFSVSGPGIDPNISPPSFYPEGLHEDFFEKRARLQSLFPRGLDIIFVCGGSVIALPRSTLVTKI